VTNIIKLAELRLLKHWRWLNVPKKRDFMTFMKFSFV